MINFRMAAQMFVAYPKNQFAVYTDNTMPRRDWSKFDERSCARLPARSVCAANFPKARVNVAARKIANARHA